jgi:RNA polymerase sigma-70 factor (ECF subfamily)
MEESEGPLRKLWDRALHDDERAYREFLIVLSNKLRPHIRRQLLRLGRDPSETEDIVQETLLAVHGKRHTYDPGIPVMAWVHAVSRYKMIDFLRSSATSNRTVSLDEAESLTSTDALHMENGLSARAVLASLPDKMRCCIELIKIGGWSAREAAAIIGMSETAVKVNVHRGLRAMARLIA